MSFQWSYGLGFTDTDPNYITAQIRKKQDELTKEFRNAHRHGSSTLKQNIEKPACLKLGIELTTKSKMNGNRNGTSISKTTGQEGLSRSHTSLGKVK